MFEKMTFQHDVMSCDFELKMVVSYIDRRSMYAEANRKQTLSRQSKLNYLQDGYLGFAKFLDFDPQNLKIKFFWENCSKIQNVPYFQKNCTYYMYRTHMQGRRHGFLSRGSNRR